MKFTIRPSSFVAFLRWHRGPAKARGPSFQQFHCTFLPLPVITNTLGELIRKREPYEGVAACFKREPMLSC